MAMLSQFAYEIAVPIFESLMLYHTETNTHTKRERREKPNVTSGTSFSLSLLFDFQCTITLQSRVYTTHLFLNLVH